MDTIFVLERAHGVHAIDAATGKPLWKFNKKLLTNPMVAWQDLLLVRTDLLETRAFKVKTGEEVLGIQMLRGHLHPKQWIVDGKDLFACMESGRLVVGNPFYPPRFTIDRKARFFSLTVSPKMVFVYSTEPPVVYAFDRLSGEQV